MKTRFRLVFALLVFSTAFAAVTADFKTHTGATGEVLGNSAQRSSTQTQPAAPSAVFTVNSTGDGDDTDLTDGQCIAVGGGCTLRAAIEQLNALGPPFPHTISFTIGGGGLQTITPGSALPPVFQPMILDGLSQGGVGYTGPPLIELNGSSAGVGANGLVILPGGSTIKGFIINRFSANGILLAQRPANTVQTNFIGTDSTGTLDLGNGQNGILIQAACSMNTIGGAIASQRNIISGNDANGIRIETDNNTVRGNRIGTKVNGTGDLGNTNDGVFIIAPENTIGGNTAAEGNIISGNDGHGVHLSGGSADSTQVRGNFIGMDVSGLLDTGNTGNGIFIENASNNRIGEQTLPPGSAPGNVIAGNGGNGIAIAGGGANQVVGNLIGLTPGGDTIMRNDLRGIDIDNSAGNIIGGSLASERNVISGHTNGGLADGIHITGAASLVNVVKGNYVGTNASGNAARSNGGNGIRIDGGAQNNFVGGNMPGDGNVISGNNANGIFLDGAGTVGTQVSGNRIGTDPAGTMNLSNAGNGVSVGGGAGGDTIGGAGVTPGSCNGPCNVISFNGGAGVSVIATTGVDIFANSIVSNGGLGIDLGGDGVTPNDPGDADTGANNLQNFPVLTSASSGSTNVTGNLNSTVNTQFTLDFYSSPTADPTGHGEGKTYIGSATVMTNASGNVSFSLSFAPTTPVGDKVSATATDPNGNTSEFSAVQTVTNPSEITLVSFTSTAYDNGVMLEWQTGFEAGNLGFNIYRDDARGRAAVNRQLIAGSALRAGSTLRAGESYALWDKGTADCRSRIADCQNARYWLEDVDVSGQSTWHGPFYAKQVGGHPPARSQAAFLSEITNNPPTESGTVERAVEMSRPSTEQVVQEASLAGQAAVKIYVKREGWYRVTQRELVAAGLSPQVDPRLLRLFAEGREQPIIVSSARDGFFDESSSIEFYGMGLDTPETNARVYWLVAGDQEGLRVQQVKGAGLPSSSPSFIHTIERKDRLIYFAALRNGERENFFGAVVSSGGVDQQLTVTHLDQSSDEPALIEIALQGVTKLRHSAGVQLNEQVIGEVAFDGQQQGVAQLRVPHSLLREGANTVRLIARNGASDVSLVDRIRLAYRHTLTADDNQLGLKAKGREQVTINGFTSTSIRVFDVTEPEAVEQLVGEITKEKSGYAVTIAPQSPGERTLIATTDDKVRQAALIKANQLSAWRSASQEADLVIISGREFLPALEPLKKARESEGYTVALADIEDVYDEFNFGNKSPQAVKDLLSFARSNWKVGPRFVLLVGDASYDAKNYLGFGDWDIVPTKLVDTDYIETASDGWFADFNGDGLSEMAVGRLPARSFEEAMTMVQKTLAYSKSEPMNEALLVADMNEGFDFEEASEQLEGLIPPAVKVEQLNRGGVESATARRRFFDAIARGQKLINYIGHGSMNSWNGGLLRSGDARELANEGRLPVFVIMTCLNGYYHDAAMDSLAEALMKAEHGGAVAVWSSSGMTLPDEQALMNKQFCRLVFQKRKKAKTLGEAAERAKTAINNKDIRRTWILLGDPTAKLR